MVPFLAPLIFHRLPLSRRHYLRSPPFFFFFLLPVPAQHTHTAPKDAHFICHLVFVVVIYFSFFLLLSFHPTRSAVPIRFTSSIIMGSHFRLRKKVVRSR